jgi:hypothetical protein
MQVNSAGGNGSVYSIHVPRKQSVSTVQDALHAGCWLCEPASSPPPPLPLPGMKRTGDAPAPAVPRRRRRRRCAAAAAAAPSPPLTLPPPPSSAASHTVAQEGRWWWWGGTGLNLLAGLHLLRSRNEGVGCVTAPHPQASRWCAAAAAVHTRARELLLCAGCHGAPATT